METVLQDLTRIMDQGSDGKHQATTAGKAEWRKHSEKSGTNGKATKTGDVTPIIPAAAGCYSFNGSNCCCTEKK